jgi:acetoacetyl-CoA synthetase
VIDSVVVGQDWQNDVRVILFVVLAEGVTLNDALIKTIKATIRSNATPRHVPAKVLQVPDIPRTISGKTVELAVRDTLHGRAVKNTDALANPEALVYFKDLQELQN